jgi:hypothetical protein
VPVSDLHRRGVEQPETTRRSRSSATNERSLSLRIAGHYRNLRAGTFGDWAAALPEAVGHVLIGPQKLT